MKKIEFNELAAEIHAANFKKGFDTKNCRVGESLMLIVTELSECLDAHQKEHHAIYGHLQNAIEMQESNNSMFGSYFENNIKNTFEDEVADSIIRLLDFAGAHGIDIDSHIALKLEYNKTRAYLHGKKY